MYVFVVQLFYKTTIYLFHFNAQEFEYQQQQGDDSTTDEEDKENKKEDEETYIVSPCTRSDRFSEIHQIQTNVKLFEENLSKLQALAQAYKNHPSRLSNFNNNTKS